MSAARAGFWRQSRWRTPRPSSALPGRHLDIEYLRIALNRLDRALRGGDPLRREEAMLGVMELLDYLSLDDDRTEKLSHALSSIQTLLDSNLFGEALRVLEEIRSETDL